MAGMIPETHGHASLWYHPHHVVPTARINELIIGTYHFGLYKRYFLYMNDRRYQMRYRNRYLICSHRIKNWNYASRGWYFITIITHNRLPLFGHIDNGVMHLNECGHIVAEEWENSKIIRPYMHFDTYVIMPDHVHFLVQLKHNQYYVPRHLIGKIFRRIARSIPSFVAAIKRICTIRVRIHHNRPHMRVWQANYHDSIPRTPAHIRTVRRYIINNPCNAHNTPNPALLHYNTSHHSGRP